MADIRPFHGYRPSPKNAKQVSCPPYDVLSSQEARVLAKGNHLSFLRVTKAEVDFSPETDEHTEPVYKKSCQNLRDLIETQILIKDAQSSFYLYEQIMNGRSQVGLVAGVSAQEYEEGKIKKHELTRRDKEDDRAHHTDVQDANTEPVMLTYRARPEIDQLVATIMKRPPQFNFVADDQITHRLWVVQESNEVSSFTEHFKKVEALYVADGHHRSAAGYRVRNLRRDRNSSHTGNEPYNHYLAVVFPDTQLQIMGYHRLVKDLNQLSVKQLLDKISVNFEITKTSVSTPQRLHEMTLFVGDCWYSLSPRPGTFDERDPVKCLDVSIAQDLLLAPILGIQDPRTDNRIDFVGGIRGTPEIERRCRLDAAVGIALFPVPVAQLMAISDSDKIMPPKSTWFEPKLRSGLVVRMLCET